MEGGALSSPLLAGFACIWAMSLANVRVWPATVKAAWSPETAASTSKRPWKFSRKRLRQRTTMSEKSSGYHHMTYCVLLLWSFQVPFAFRLSVGGSSMYAALSDAHAAQ